MNINVTFHIVVGKYDQGKSYRMLVEHYYSSSQVERFKIHGRERFISMEKRLSVNKQPWKIIEGQVDLINIQQAAMAVFEMQRLIDNYLELRKNDPGKISGHFIPDEKSKYKY